MAHANDGARAHVPHVAPPHAASRCSRDGSAGTTVRTTNLGARERRKGLGLGAGLGGMGTVLGGPLEVLDHGVVMDAAKHLLLNQAKFLTGG